MPKKVFTRCCERRKRFERSMRPSTDDNLRQLITRCLRGDGNAQLELVQRFQGAVFGLCFRMLRHRQDAEDAAQESLVRMLRSLHRWDAARDFEPWLLAIAGNRCRTALSNRKRKGLGEELPEQIPDRPGNEGSADHLAEEVQQALGRMREDYRAAFVLFHENEFSYQQIAETLSVPLGTVKTWVHRARKEIIDHLRQRGIVAEPRHEMPRV